MVQVDDVQPGIDGGFGQHHVGIRRRRAHVGAHRLDDRNPLRRKVLRRIPAHLVITVGGHHKLGTGFGEHTQRRRDRCHAGTERQCRRSTFEFGQCRFQLAPGRIGAAAVAVQWFGLVGRQVICRRRNGRRRHRLPGIARSNGFDAASGIAVRAVHLSTPVWCCAPAEGRRPRRPIIPCGRRAARIGERHLDVVTRREREHRFARCDALGDVAARGLQRRLHGAAPTEPLAERAVARGGRTSPPDHRRRQALPWLRVWRPMRFRAA